MNCRAKIFSVLLIAIFAISGSCRAQERVARLTQGDLVFSNWDAPYLSLDTCLNMTLTEITIPDHIFSNGRDYPVIEVGHNAFNGARQLKVLSVGSIAKGFLRGALLNCPNLRIIKTECTTPASFCSIHSYYGAPIEEVIEPYHFLTTIIVVPPGYEQVYRNTEGWKEFKHIQSHMPTGAELQVNEIDMKIIELESLLRKSEQEVEDLKQQIQALRQAKQESQPQQQ